MRPQPIMLRLGAQEWRVRPLTLRQVQEIEPWLLAPDQSAGHSIATAVKIIAIALMRDHQEAADKLDEIEASAQEIAAAMGEVLRLGGFIAANASEAHDSGNALAGVDRISAQSTPA